MILTLTFNPLWAMVMTYSLAKVQGQRWLGSKDRVETNGRTAAIPLPPSLKLSVTNSVAVSRSSLHWLWLLLHAGKSCDGESDAKEANSSFTCSQWYRVLYTDFIYFYDQVHQVYVFYTMCQNTWEAESNALLSPCDLFIWMFRFIHYFEYFEWRLIVRSIAIGIISWDILLVEKYPLYQTT